MKTKLSLDNLLPLVLAAFVLLCGSAVWHEAAQAFSDASPSSTQA